MERELLVERTRAGLAAVKKLGRVGGRKRLMTNSKIQSVKTLLAMACHLGKWRGIWEFLSQRSTAGCLHPNTLNARFFPFRELSLYPPLLWLLYLGVAVLGMGLAENDFLAQLEVKCSLLTSQTRFHIGPFCPR